MTTAIFYLAAALGALCILGSVGDFLCHFF